MNDWSFFDKYNQISPAAKSLNEFGEKKKKKKKTPFLDTINYSTNLNIGDNGSQISSGIQKAIQWYAQKHYGRNATQKDITTMLQNKDYANKVLSEYKFHQSPVTTKIKTYANSFVNNITHGLKSFFNDNRLVLPIFGGNWHDFTNALLEKTSETAGAVALAYSAVTAADAIGTLRKSIIGETNDNVKIVQDALKEKGYNIKVTPKNIDEIGQKLFGDKINLSTMERVKDAVGEHFTSGNKVIDAIRRLQNMKKAFPEGTYRLSFKDMAQGYIARLPYLEYSPIPHTSKDLEKRAQIRTEINANLTKKYGVPRYVQDEDAYLSHLVNNPRFELYLEKSGLTKDEFISIAKAKLGLTPDDINSQYYLYKGFLGSSPSESVLDVPSISIPVKKQIIATMNDKIVGMVNGMSQQEFARAVRALTPSMQKIATENNVFAVAARDFIAQLGTPAKVEKTYEAIKKHQFSTANKQMQTITLYRADTGMGAFPHVTYATGYPEIAKTYGAKVQKLSVNIPENQILHITYKVPTKAAYDFHDVVVGDRKIDFQRISPEDKEYLLKKGYKAIDVTKINLDGTSQPHYEVVLLDKSLIKNSTPIKVASGKTMIQRYHSAVSTDVLGEPDYNELNNVKQSPEETYNILKKDTDKIYKTIKDIKAKWQNKKINNIEARKVVTEQLQILKKIKAINPYPKDEKINKVLNEAEQDLKTVLKHIPVKNTISAQSQPIKRVTPTRERGNFYDYEPASLVYLKKGSQLIDKANSLYTVKDIQKTSNFSDWKITLEDQTGKVMEKSGLWVAKYLADTSMPKIKTEQPKVSTPAQNEAPEKVPKTEEPAINTQKPQANSQPEENSNSKQKAQNEYSSNGQRIPTEKLPPKKKLIEELGLNQSGLNDSFYEAVKKMDLAKNLQAFDTRYTNLHLILSSKYFKPYLQEDIARLVDEDRSTYALKENLYNKKITTKDAINKVLIMWHEVKRIASLYRQHGALSVENAKKLPELKAGMSVSSKDVGKTYRVGSWVGKLVEFDNMYGIQAEYKLENGKLVKDVSWIPVYPKNKRNKPGYMSLDLGSDIIDSLKELFHPEKQSEKDLAYNTLNAIRKLEIGANLAKRLAVKTRDSLLKRIGKPNKVFLKIVDDWLDQPDKFQELYDTLPEEYKELGILIKQTYKRLGEYAKENDILEELRDNYTMHIYKDNESILAKQLFPSGGKLGTKFRYARARVYATKEEAVAHGLHPIDNPILKIAIYTQQLFLTLNNKEFIQQLLPSLVDKETGLPAVMKRPRSSDKEALSIYNNIYEELQNRNLSQWMWLKSEDDTNLMVKIPLKAHPKVAQIINSYTKPHLPPHGFVKYYLAIRALVKRSIFFNPLIHGVNIEGVRTAIWAATNPFMKRPKLNEQQLNSMERYAINSGMVLGGYSKQIMYDLVKEMKPDQNIVTSLISDAMKMNDTLLWDIMVPHAQLSSFYRLTTMIKKAHPEWSKEKIGKYAADALNPFYGTMPDSWFPEIARNLGSVGFLAFKWTASNIDLIVKSLTFGKRGLGTGTMDNDEKRFIGKLNIAYFFASLFMLLIAVNVSQLGLEAARNKLIDLGVIKGDKVKLHTTFQNEIERNVLNIFSVDSGTKNPKGQEQYYSFPLFRWIRDVFAWATSPRQTVVNKAEPLLKTTLEFLFNYSTWQHKPIVPEGYSTIEGLKKYVAYGLEALTPSQYFMPKNNAMETILPFFGAWVSSGAKGGKYTTLYYKYLNEKEAKNDTIDQQIDKLLSQNKITEAENLMVSSGRYRTRRAIIDRILNYKIPIRRALMDKNYLRWLLSKGYTLDEIKKEYNKELKEANLTP